MRDAAPFAVDVKTEFAFRVFRAEINFARRRVKALRHDNEMMNQLLHLGHDARFWRQHVFPIDDIDRAFWQFPDDLPQNARALPHLFHANEVAIVTIASAADDDIEIVFLVVEIRMFATQIVVDATSPQVRTRERVSDRAITRDHADVPRAIDEDTVTRQQFVDFVELRNEIVEKFLKRGNERLRQITDLAADSRVRGGKSRAG